jgi:hypothetical protein
VLTAALGGSMGNMTGIGTTHGSTSVEIVSALEMNVSSTLRVDFNSGVSLSMFTAGLEHTTSIAQSASRSSNDGESIRFRLPFLTGNNSSRASVSPASTPSGSREFSACTSDELRGVGLVGPPPKASSSPPLAPADPVTRSAAVASNAPRTAGDKTVAVARENSSSTASVSLDDADITPLHIPARAMARRACSAMGSPRSEETVVSPRNRVSANCRTSPLIAVAVGADAAVAEAT